MAGRGCTITVTVLGGGPTSADNYDISLPVALHSPLEVLKDQLGDLVNIPPQDQMLILLDPSDPDGNSDVLLSGREYMSLRQCGLQNGSTLTLHALGVSAERQQRQRQEEQEMQEKELLLQRRLNGSRFREHNSGGDKQNKFSDERTLHTRVTAAEADHSYNGVIFDAFVDGPFEVELKSISVAGMLGRIRVYGRDRPWEAPDRAEDDDEAEQGRFRRSWGHQGNVGTTGWVLLADQVCQPAWDRPTEILLNRPGATPFRLQPYKRRGLYVHSNLPDDLGIQYNSFSKKQIVAQNEHLRIMPGLGHTGSGEYRYRLPN